MKKFIAAAVLAGLATTAFAQTPAPTFTWGGYLDTGLTVVANGKDKASIGLWGDDSGVNGGQFRLTGKVNGGDYGFNFDLRQDGLVNTNVPYLKSAYVYGNFFSKMVYAQAGIVDQRDSRTGGDAAWSYTKETPGAVVVVKPVDGLSLNAFVQPSSTANAVGNLVDTTASVGGAYTLPNVVKVVAQAKTSYTAAKVYAVSDFYAGAGLLAVPNLTAWVEFQNAGLNNGALKGKTTIVETLSYGFKDLGLAPLTAGVAAYQFLYGDDWTTNGAAKDKAGLSLKVKPWASYAFDGGITPKLSVTYWSGADLYGLVNSPVAANYKSDLAYVSTNQKADANKVALFEINPSVKIALSPTQTLTFAYLFDTSIGSDDISFVTGTADAKSQHTLQANFTYTF